MAFYTTRAFRQNIDKSSVIHSSLLLLRYVMLDCLEFFLLTFLHGANRPRTVV